MPHLTGNDSPNLAPQAFSNALLQWFDHCGRHDLPWQKDKTPYRVWVSEIMLQQTQVTTVIPYYERFMASFPTLQSLAIASEDQVLAHWAGLGYYARGRNLHKTAKICVEELDGEIPATLESLQALPGIGRSTAGAILSISQNLRAPILDGNVKRVLCRYLGMQTWPGERNTEKKLWQIADSFTPHERVDDYTQAIMDLGATLCSRSKPACHRCPFSDSCWAYKNEKTATLPVRKPTKSIPTQRVWVLIIRNESGELFLEKRPPSGIWGGLWTLPQLAEADDTAQQIEQRVEDLAKRNDWTVTSTQTQPLLKHTFSHFHLHMTPIAIQLAGKSMSYNSINEAPQQWATKDQLDTIGLPAPIKKLLNS